DFGCRYFHQAALPEGHGRRRAWPVGDTSSAQARPEPIRPAFRQGNHQSIREQCAVRIDQDEVTGVVARSPNEAPACAGAKSGDAEPGALGLRDRKASTSEEPSALMARDIVRLGKVVRESGAKGGLRRAPAD